MSGERRRQMAAHEVLEPDEIVRRDALSTALLGAAARALQRGVEAGGLDGDGREGPDGGTGEGDDARGGIDARAALLRVASQPARSTAVGGVLAAERAPAIDAEAVAAWMTGRYGEQRYPGVVFGSAHAGAVHLALALGVPWLPAYFDTGVQGPALGVELPTVTIEHGKRLAEEIGAANAEVTVRQIHEPVRRRWPVDRTLALRVRWRRLPAAYRAFLSDRLLPGAPAIVVRDVSRWLVVQTGEQHTFQLGSRSNGMEAMEYYERGDRLRQALSAAGHRADLVAGISGYSDGDGEHAVEAGFVDDLRWRTTEQGRRLRQVLYRRPEVLSTGVADLYRRWLRGGGRTGDRLVVECGRLFDPWQVLRAGLVPYWCEHAVVTDVAAAEWWLAGSEPFTSIEALPEPPGVVLPTTAYLAQWASAAAFATRRGVIDPRCARSYPLGGVPPEHAESVLAHHPYDLPYLPPLVANTALDEMAGHDTGGLLVL